MAAVNFDIKKVRNANYELPTMLSNLSVQARNINMLKWRISDDIQDRRNIRQRLDVILREMERAEQQLGDVYRVAGSAVTQYANTETRLTENATKFE